jgi:hypothetical protein
MDEDIVMDKPITNEIIAKNLRNFFIKTNFKG